MSTSPAIGIDLGTTYSRVGVFHHGKVEIIVNGEGYHSTPSYVAFIDGLCLIGDAAKNQRLLGRHFNNKAVQDDIKHWLFKVINSEEEPRIEVENRGKTKHFVAEEISTMILLKMKETAEAYLGKEVTDAVISVPSHFNNRQRQATLDAGKIAGLNVLRLINEPTAAALAYGMDKKVDEQRNMLVNVSILSIENGKFVVKSTVGDGHFGGEDFDSQLVDHFVEKFKQDNKGVKSTLSKKGICRLRSACEKAERMLSSTDYAKVCIELLFEGIDFRMTLTLARSEHLCSDLFSRMLDPVKKALSDANLDKADVEEIVLVGASTGMPKVQQLLQDFFDGRKLNKSINPDEAVAFGAVLLEAKLSGDKSEAMQNFKLLEVAPNTLVLDTQTVSIRVYENEGAEMDDDHLLGQYTLPMLPHGVIEFDVTFDIDDNGSLIVSVAYIGSGTPNNFTLTCGRSRQSEDEVGRMVNDAEKLKQEDREERSRMAAKCMLEDYICSITSNLGK
uniref:Heat shock protein 70 n=1 Tax=Echinococcus granulosus TaxID=6210 RepID=A0A068WQQ4_ECHGR|nr:heat shock protein 70 [Echinococcus granulosus]